VIDLPLANVPYGVQVGTPEQTRERERNPEAYPRLKVGVRALLPFEREKVLELAGARAKAKGGTAEEANPLYRHAMAIYTVAVACVDPETLSGDAPLFFGDTIEEAAEKLRTSRHITDDIVLFLREQQEIWQDQINPQALTIADNELWSVAQKAAESEDFLHYFRPGMLARLAHLLAGLLLNAHEDKLPSSAPATASTSGG
jgi:hypothetical protein